MHTKNTLSDCRGVFSSLEIQILLAEDFKEFRAGLGSDRSISFNAWTSDAIFHLEFLDCVFGAYTKEVCFVAGRADSG